MNTDTTITTNPDNVRPSSSSFKPGLRAINEETLNNLLDSIPKDIAHDFIRKKLPTPSNKRVAVRLNDFVSLPRFVKTLVVELALLDEPDIVRRFDICVGYMRVRDYSINTINRYLKLLRKHGIFGDGTAIQHLKCDSTLFKNQKHTRIVDKFVFIKFINYLSNNFTKFSAPLLMSIYTGLRTTEILQFNTIHLKQLINKTTIVDIKRKNTSLSKKIVFWQPNYIKQFNDFIKQLHLLYKIEYDTFENTNIDVRLFNVSPRTLVNREQTLFFRATGQKMPFGYGIHGNRTTMASIMYDTTPNLVAVKAFLQHKNLSSTRKYVRADICSLERQFDRITSEHFKDVLETLE